MTITHVVGIDPGIIHTGVVRLIFNDLAMSIVVEHAAVVGPDAAAVQAFVRRQHGPAPHIFIERYMPRSHFNTDARMAQAQAEIKAALPRATTVLNTGVKKVVKKPLMELLKVWTFPTATNHQDLRAAARIALFGMLKSEPLNRLLADVVRDHIAGDDWHVALP